MSTTVNKDLCIGCGVCTSLCPSTFQMNTDGKPEVINEGGQDCTQSAAESCPVQAILIS